MTRLSKSLIWMQKSPFRAADLFNSVKLTLDDLTLCVGLFWYHILYLYWDEGSMTVGFMRFWSLQLCFMQLVDMPSWRHHLWYRSQESSTSHTFHRLEAEMKSEHLLPIIRSKLTNVYMYQRRHDSHHFHTHQTIQWASLPFREAFVMLHKSFIQVIHVCHASVVVRHVQYLDLLPGTFCLIQVRHLRKENF